MAFEVVSHFHLEVQRCTAAKGGQQKCNRDKFLLNENYRKVCLVQFYVTETYKLCSIIMAPKNSGGSVFNHEII